MSLPGVSETDPFHISLKNSQLMVSDDGLFSTFVQINKHVLELFNDNHRFVQDHGHLSEIRSAKQVDLLLHTDHGLFSL